MSLPRRALCGFGLLAWLPAAPAATEGGVLRIETIQSEPFGRIGPQGASGLMVDIGMRIAQRAGLAAENRVVPYARTVLSLQNGSADMVLRFSNEELQAVAVQVAPVLPLPTVLVSRRVDAAYGSNLGLFGAARELGLRMQQFARPVVVER